MELTYNVTTAPGVSFQEQQSRLRTFKDKVNDILTDYQEHEYGVENGMRPERVHVEITDLRPHAAGSDGSDGEGYYADSYADTGSGSGSGSGSGTKLGDYLRSVDDYSGDDYYYQYEEPEGPYTDEYGNMVMGSSFPSAGIGGSAGGGGSYDDDDGAVGTSTSAGAGEGEGGGEGAAMDGPMENPEGEGDGGGEGGGGKAILHSSTEAASPSEAQAALGPYPTTSASATSALEAAEADGYSIGLLRRRSLSSSRREWQRQRRQLRGAAAGRYL